jgi:hypothetical protein
VRKTTRRAGPPAGVLELLEAPGDPVDLELDGVEDPELEVVHPGLPVDHPDDLQGNQEQGELGRQEMREPAQIQVEKLPHQIEAEYQKYRGQEEDIDDPVPAGLDMPPICPRTRRMRSLSAR